MYYSTDQLYLLGEQPRRKTPIHGTADKAGHTELDTDEGYKNTTIKTAREDRIV